uniref:Uncharacterized protein n=1 Tax=Arundo donax TaxID=35708 RepID=A0A0A9DXY2_ARUDO
MQLGQHGLHNPCPFICMHACCCSADVEIDTPCWWGNGLLPAVARARAGAAACCILSSHWSCRLMHFPLALETLLDAPLAPPVATSLKLEKFVADALGAWAAVNCANLTPRCRTAASAQWHCLRRVDGCLASHAKLMKPEERRGSPLLLPCLIY